MSGIVRVSVAINLGNHAAQGVRTKELFFTHYPTTLDVINGLGTQDDYLAIVEACEVAEIGDYVDGYDTANGFISFECHDDAGDSVGSIIIEGCEVIESSLIQAD